MWEMARLNCSKITRRKSSNCPHLLHYSVLAFLLLYYGTLGKTLRQNRDYLHGKCNKVWSSKLYSGLIVIAAVRDET